VARARGRRFAVKCSNTLVVKNHRAMFRDDVMYLSGPPLHVITMNLVRRLRDRLGGALPVSFSAGLDAHNVAGAVAMNMVPCTVCTDLLRPGGYGRLPRYVANLEARMRELGVARVPDFVLRHAGNAAAAVRGVVAGLDAAIGAAAGETDSGASERMRAWLHAHCAPQLAAWAARGPGGEGLDAVCARLADEFERDMAHTLPPAVAAPCRSRLAALEQTLVDAAGLLNTATIVESTSQDPRYGRAKNQAVPRKIGSHLWLFDCVNCDKCVPVCPNDANFVYEGRTMQVPFEDVEIDAKGRWRTMPGEAQFAVGQAHQLANYADFCNDCGNCDVFCPEDGGPQVEKPRFFGSLDTYRAHAGRNGFFLEGADGLRTIHGTIEGRPYRLELDAPGGRGVFHDGVAVTEIALDGNRVVACRLEEVAPPFNLHRVEMARYLTLRHLAEAVSDPRHVNFVNVAER